MQNVKYVIICKKCNNIFGRDSNICDETIYKSKGMLNLNQDSVWEIKETGLGKISTRIQR